MSRSCISPHSTSCCSCVLSLLLHIAQITISLKCDVLYINIICILFSHNVASSMFQHQCCIYVFRYVYKELVSHQPSRIYSVITRYQFNYYLRKLNLSFYSIEIIQWLQYLWISQYSMLYIWNSTYAYIIFIIFLCVYNFSWQK